MPLKHRSWKDLYKHIEQIEAREKARKPNGNTLLIAFDEAKYDRNIPILDERFLNKWLYRSVWAPKTKPPKRLRETEPSKTKSKSKGVKVKKRPRRQPPEIVELADTSESDVESQGQPKEIQSESKESDEPDSVSTETFDDSSCAANQSETIWQGELDGLTINENYDEYAQFDDDDDDIVETQFSKNLKKIKSEVPKQTINLPPRDEKSNKLKCFFTPPPPPPVLKVVPKPVEPNWPEVLKQVENNQLNIALKDLCFFKSRIKTDELARTLPKELILKCLSEDDTMTLVSALELYYEMDFEEDIEFNTELVKRFKRKLNPHVRVRLFKSKMNPDTVYRDYKRAMVKLIRIASDRNLTLSIPWNDWKFLDSIDTEDSGQRNAPTISTSVEPEPHTSKTPEAAKTTLKTNNSPPPLRPFNFKVFLGPDIKPVIKKENANNQPNSNGTPTHDGIAYSNGTAKSNGISNLNPQRELAFKTKRCITSTTKIIDGQRVYKIRRTKNNDDKEQTFKKKFMMN